MPTSSDLDDRRDPGDQGHLGKRDAMVPARRATEADRIDGVEVGQVVMAGDATQVAGALRAATEAGATVVARGGGTKLDWGSPPQRADIIVDVSGLDDLVEHAAGDLVVRVGAGVRLRDLQECLAPAGQRLALDEVVAGSTVGGVIATGLSGPMRLVHGSVRDLLLGVTVALADGRLVTSGGRVVKNVAGYDLGKLYTGSFGTLGIVTEAFLRLHPRPRRSAWVAVAVTRTDDVAPVVGALGAAGVAPVAIEVHDGGGHGLEVVALLEGSAPGVDGRLNAARHAVDLPALRTGAVTMMATAPPWWARLPGVGEGETLMKLTTTVAGVGPLLDAVRGAADHLVEVELSGSAGVGVLYAGLGSGSEPAAVGGVLAAARQACRAVGGAAVVLRTPPLTRAAIDAWGPVGALALMGRVKQGFDPHRVLAPGRFVGGI